MAPDTIRRVARPTNSLTPAQLRRVEKATAKRAAEEAAYRAEILAVAEEAGSIRETADAAKISPTTLQKWKREATDG